MLIPITPIIGVHEEKKLSWPGWTWEDDLFIVDNYFTPGYISENGYNKEDKEREYSLQQINSCRIERKSQFKFQIKTKRGIIILN